MIGSFSRLETLLRALYSQQRAVDVANHNIANANTPGFTRQAAVFGTTPPYTMPTLNRSAEAGQVGTGVTVVAIQRVREGFLDLQFRLQSERLGEAGARSSIYRQLELVFNEPNPSGLNSALETFWQGWQNLANHPEDPAYRGALIEQAQTLAGTITSTRQQLDALTGNSAQMLSDQVEQVNSLARRIADLNGQITNVLGTGQQPNDLMDARDQLLDQLAGLVKTTNVVTPDGAVNIYISGHALVDRIRPGAVALDVSGATATITWQDDGSTVAVAGGSLAGLLEMHNTVLPGVQADVLALRDTLAAEVNAIHQTGYGLSDAAGPAPNREFFQIDGQGNLRVNPAIVADPSLLAASSAADTPGNTDVARAIASLRDALTMGTGTATINGFYQTMIARIGSEARESAQIQTNQETLVHSIERRRQEVSGVSLDEEATNLVKFQHAYQAASRAMTVVDEMLDRLINSTGIVGR